MDHLRQEIKKHKVLERWNLLSNQWDERLDNIDAILIKDGDDLEEYPKAKITAFQQWFFRFEFIKTIQIISRNTMIFMGSKEKVAFLEVLNEDAKKYNKKIVFIEISENPSSQNMDSIFAEIKKLNLKNFGVFKQEVQKGKVIEMFEQQFKSNPDFQEIDIASQIQTFICVKNKADEVLLRKASDITVNYFDNFISMVEFYIDEGEKIKHSEISAKMEEKLVKTKKSLKVSFEVLPNFYDFAYTPVIQSGKQYNLKLNSRSNKDYLENNVILLNLGGKYFEMNCNIFRTLMINPTAEDKHHYQALYFLHRTIIKSLKKGAILSDVYNKSKEDFIKRYPELKDHVPSHFGFGTGYQIREKLLSINSKNTEQKVESGNVFMVITNLKNLKNSKEHEYSIHLSDTIFVNQNGEPENLTGQIKCSFDDIGYDINEQQEENEANRQHQNNKQQNNYPRLSRSEMRRKKIEEEQKRNKTIKENQTRLLDEKLSEIKDRIKSGDFSNDASQSNKIVLQKLNVYSDGKLPKLNPKEIHVDEQKQVVLLPINKKLVPVHAHCIKNVTKHNEKGFYSLRVNFQTPLQGTGGIEFPSQVGGQNPIYIKELTFKSSYNESILNACRKIKDLIKNVKLQLKINQKQAQEQKKENLKDKIDSLNDLKMRPTLSGRKTAGHLVAYYNGFKFNSKSNQSFILFNNSIKQAIFQPCDDNLMVILHFFLKFPVVINKKTTLHVQFYAEVAQGVEDVNEQRRRGRMGRYDEYDEEQMEEEQRRHYNNLFIQFVRNIQNNWSLKGQEFDSPYYDLGFYGSPSQNNVFIMPSKYTLMSISEKPFFVLMLEDIELVSIERIDNKIKNFDMIIIFKDYKRPVVNIDNIPKIDLDKIKIWLNDNNIIFIEGGAINIRWDKYLKKVLEDPKDFVSQGAWKGFVIDSESEEELDDDDDSEVKSSSLEEGAEDDDFEIDDEEFEEEEYDDDDYNDDDEDDEEEYDDESDDDSRRHKKRKKNRK